LKAKSFKKKWNFFLKVSYIQLQETYQPVIMGITQENIEFDKKTKSGTPIGKMKRSQS